jgi:AraC-like DNA-binding protein
LSHQADPPIIARPLAEGEGWRVREVVCRSGPGDPRFEERHEWTSVAAVLGGVFTYRSNRGRAVLTPGALLLGEAGGCFECGHDHSAGDRCLSVHLSPELTEEVVGGLKGARSLGFKRPNTPPIEPLLPLLARARALAQTPDPLAGEQLALDLTAAAFRLDHDADDAAPRRSDEARAARAARIIEARLGEPLTIAGLAAEVGLARRSFATAFKAAVGATPYNFILGRRLDAAAVRLADGSGSVLEIALDVGFGDLSEFTRRFRARYGVPPGLSRRRHLP